MTNTPNLPDIVPQLDARALRVTVFVITDSGKGGCPSCLHLTRLLPTSTPQDPALSRESWDLLAMQHVPDAHPEHFVTAKQKLLAGDFERYEAPEPYDEFHCATCGAQPDFLYTCRFYDLDDLCMPCLNMHYRMDHPNAYYYDHRGES